MQKNDVIRLKIEEINNLGYGVGHIGASEESRGQVVFVKGAVTGDEIDARIIKINKTYLVGRIERILSPSPMRNDRDLCTSAAGCGGCVYRNIGYEHELEMKRRYVENAFRKAGLPSVAVESVLTVGKTDCYRNKAQYPLQNGKRGMEAGFFATATHRLVPTENCRLQPPEFALITAAVTDFCTSHGIRAYEEERGSGLVRHIYLRQGTVTGEMMVCLVINGTSIPHENELAEVLCRRFPNIKSIVLNINTRNTNVVLGDTYRNLYGDGTIEDILCGLRFRISPGSFYQVNHDACELLYAKAAELADLTGRETVLDLYCGIGSIGLSMAHRAGKVIGIEIVEEAVRCAEENARRNGIQNASFYCGDASDAKKLLAGAEAKGEIIRNATVILDPPRKGSTPELIGHLAERNFSHIVYISCNPDTLARDCALFRSLGYSIGTVTPVDLFPRTGHCEAVVSIRKDENKD